MLNFFLGFAIGAVLIFALRTVLRRSNEGSACCGSPGERIRAVPVRDRNPKHYPFEAEIAVGGMTCQNCATRVENALNALEGTWARVSLEKKTAHVRTKATPDLGSLENAVRGAGYAPLSSRLL